MDFEQFYSEHKALVYRICLAKTHKELAEESTARAFVEVWKRWDYVSNMEAPVAYVITIAKNIVKKEYLKSKARQIFRLDTIEDLATHHSPQQDALKNETLEEFWSALAQLSDREQEIIILKDIEERSLEECTEILNLSLSAVKSLRHRAKEKLSRILKTGVPS
ncbi:MAG: RNA polymerase sigma factor [Brevinema sp.]